MHKISGSHPLILEFNGVIEEASAKLSNLRKRIDAATKVANKTIHPIYRLESCETDGEGLVRWNLMLTNRQQYDDHMSTYGISPGFWDTRLRSVGYRWVNGVVLHFSGGHMIWGGFDKVVLMTEDEWHAVLECKIPERVREGMSLKVLAKES